MAHTHHRRLSPHHNPTGTISGGRDVNSVETAFIGCDPARDDRKADALLRVCDRRTPADRRDCAIVLAGKQSCDAENSECEMGLEVRISMVEGVYFYRSDVRGDGPLRGNQHAGDESPRESGPLRPSQ